MGAYINKLVDIDDDTLYPITVAGAVYTSPTTTLAATLDTKLNKSGHATSHAVVTNSNGNIVTLSNVTSYDIGRLEGLTGNVQAQINGKQSKLYIRKYRLGTEEEWLNYVIGDNGWVKVDNIFDNNRVASTATVYSVQLVDLGNYKYPCSLIYEPDDIPTREIRRGDIYLQGFPDSFLRHMSGIDVNGLTITSVRIMIVYSV